MKTELLGYSHDITELFHRFSHLTQSTLFDSGHPSHHAGNIDIFSAIPIKELTIDHHGITLIEQNKKATLKNIEALIELLKQDWNTIDNDHPFSGGWIGHASYELAHFLEPSSLGQAKQSRIPFFWAGYYNWAVINDHKKQIAYLVYEETIKPSTLTRIRALLHETTPPKTLTHFELTQPFSPSVDIDDYKKQFEKVKQHIGVGDCYQVNYTFPFQGTFKGSPFDAYCRLRNAVPSPFMHYLNNGYTILSISPERFIQAQGQTAITQPIKGTAPRYPEDIGQDQQSAKSLQTSVKDRAENVMIVDLLRNDFGKLCTPGSVKVSELFSVESYRNVHHLVSTIHGEITRDKNIWDLFFSAFPGGSITGAPKIRACQIISQIESNPRHIYCGSLFYASNNGRFDSNIAIRTLLCHNEDILASVGGGIVADSTQDDEYNECLIKISRLLAALT